MLSVVPAANKGRALRAVLAIGLLTGMAGCKLVDQRTFNPIAGVEPRPYIPPPPPGPPPVPPLIELVAGTPQAEWKAPVDQIARKALARKKEVLFVVRCLVPVPVEQSSAAPEPTGGAVTAGPEQTRQESEQSALLALVQHDGHAVMQELIDAGAPQEQVEMSAMPDSSVTKPTVRVYVR